MQPPNPSIEKLMKLSILGQTDEPQNPLQQGINKTGAGFQLPQIAPQVPQGQLLPQIPQVAPTLNTPVANMDLSSAANVNLGGGEFHSPFPLVSPMMDPRRDTGSFAGTGSGAILDIPQNLPQDTNSGAGGFAGAEEVVSGVAPKPSLTAQPSLFDPAAASDPDPFADTSTGIGMLPQPYLQAADTRTPAEIAQAQASKDPAQPPLNLVGFDPQFAGQSLADFMAGRDDPSLATRQIQDPQGRFRRQAVPIAGETPEQTAARTADILPGQADFASASAAREQRAAEQFGVARGPDAMDRDAGEMSMADARDLDNLKNPRATEGERARAMQVAERLGRDPMTGAPIRTAQEGMTPYQTAQIELQKAGLGLKMTEAEAKAAGVSQKQYDKMAKAAGALQSLEADLNLVREKGEEIKDLTMKPRTQGLLAKALTKISPTSTAAQLERASGTLTGDAFIKGMRVIKEFGGGLGSVTEVEGMKVERAQGAIFEAGMSDAERRNAVDNYLEVRENAYNRIRGAFVDEFGEEQANRYLGGGAGQAAVSNGAIQVPTVEGVTIEEIN